MTFDGYIYGTLAEKYCTWAPSLTALLEGHADPSAIPLQPLSLGIGASPVAPPGFDSAATLSPAPATP